MSLSVRLFGNIFGKEMVLAILFGLAGLYLAPLPIMFLGILVCFIQALVFMLLATMYFVGAMEHATDSRGGRKTSKTPLFERLEFMEEGHKKY